MIEVGFLDSATTPAAVNESLRLDVEGNNGSLGPWRAPFFMSEVYTCNIFAFHVITLDSKKIWKFKKLTNIHTDFGHLIFGKENINYSQL